MPCSIRSRPPYRGKRHDIDLNRREVGITTPQGRNVLPYDRLVMAAGSEVARPPVRALRSCLQR